jgi:lipopolysaccharide biosynthesis glycosyltransferase
MISSVSTDIPLATTSKNLVYLSVYFDKGYVELMNNSLMSIIKHATIDFDVLVITDETTQQLIAKQPFTQHIQPKYHITPTPIDGVEASKNKTLIYDYADVDEYDKILFLDCDVVAVGDIASVFDVCVDHNRLYTARGINIAFHHHRSFHHGFDVVKQVFIDEMTDARQYPFNAGQFMFRNSNIMREHFHNLNWFMKAWPGEYFFEQAFMCYYFCKAKITNDALNSKLALISTVVENTYSLRGKTLLHFTAPPLDAITKINFINNFIAKHYEQSTTSKI